MRKKYVKPDLSKLPFDTRLRWLAPKATYTQKGETIICCVLLICGPDALVSPLKSGPSVDWVPKRWLTFV